VVRRYTADTLALLVFSTLGALLTEIVIAGLSPSQSAHARLTAIPVILATARPYGLYRDRVMRRLRAGETATRARRTTADTLAFLTFQLPIYWTILAFAGASLRQAAVSSVAATALIVVSGRPYGLLLDLCRRLLRVPTPEPEDPSIAPLAESVPDPL
jgi:hypothetical protein